MTIKSTFYGKTLFFVLFCLVGSTSNVRLEFTDPEIENYMLC